MDISTLKDLLLNYFQKDFDHDLVNDQSNDPFVQFTLINLSNINPHRDSFGLYLKKTNQPAVHTGFTTTNMANASVLEAKYLIQKPSRSKPIDDPTGYVRGITIGKKQVLLISVVTNSDDARFVCQSIINKVQIFIEKH